MSTTRVQVHLDPFYMDKKDDILNYAKAVADNCDIFEVPNSCSLTTISVLRLTHGAKSILVRVESLDDIDDLVNKGVDMIGFVGNASDKNFDKISAKYPTVKFVVDLTHIADNIDKVAQYYIDNDATIFNFNSDSVNTLSNLKDRIIILQTLDCRISITGRHKLSDIKELIRSLKIDIIALVDTTYEVAQSNSLKAAVARSTNDRDAQIKLSHNEHARNTVLGIIKEVTATTNTNVLTVLNQIGRASSICAPDTTTVGDIEAQLIRYRKKVADCKDSSYYNKESLTAKIQISTNLSKAIDAKITQHNTNISAFNTELCRIDPKINFLYGRWYGINYVYNVAKIENVHNLANVHYDILNQSNIVCSCD